MTLRQLIQQVPQTRAVPYEPLQCLFESRLLGATGVSLSVSESPHFLDQLQNQEYGEIWQEMANEINAVDIKLSVTADIVESDPLALSVVSSHLMKVLVTEVVIATPEQPQTQPPIAFNVNHNVPAAVKRPLLPSPTPTAKRIKVDQTQTKPTKIRDNEDSLEYLTRLNTSVSLQLYGIEDLKHILRNSVAVIDETTDWAHQAAAAKVITTVLDKNSEVSLHLELYYRSVLTVIKSQHGNKEFIADLLAHLPIQSDHVVTLEYVCFDIIFSEDHTPEVLRHAAIQCLVQIFHKFVDQQPFILEMVARRADSGGRLKLVRGGSVRLTTALFVLMIQSTPNIAELSGHICDQLVSYSIIDDLLQLLDLPEWPGAEQLVALVVALVMSTGFTTEAIEGLSKFCLKWASTHREVGMCSELTELTQKLRSYLYQFGTKNSRYNQVYCYHDGEEMKHGLGDSEAVQLWQKVWVARLNQLYTEAAVMFVNIPGARLQAKAVRTLAQLVEFDSLLVSSVLNAFKRYKNAALTMRDALLDLASKLLQLGAHFENFAEVLVLFLNDESALVKKRSLKVISELWDQTAMELQILLLKKLLSRGVHEEDTNLLSKIHLLVSSRLDAVLITKLAAVPELVSHLRLYPPLDELVQLVVELAESEVEGAVEGLVALTEVVSLGQDQLSVLQLVMGTLVSSLKVLQHSLSTTILRPEINDGFYTILTKGLGSFLLQELDYAVPALVVLAKRGKMNHLAQYVKAILVNISKGQEDAKLAKLCYLLGLFAKYGDWELYRDHIAKIPDAELVTSYFCRILIAVYSGAKLDLVARETMAGLLEACSSHPHLFKVARIKQIIKKGLRNSKLTPVITAKLLVVIGGNLERSPTRFRLDQTLVEVAPMLVDEFLECVLGMVYRLPACTEFLYEVVNQGLTLPAKCVAPAIGLMTHSNPDFRKTAEKVLTTLIAKYALLIQFEEGLRLGFDYAGPMPSYLNIVYQHLNVTLAGMQTVSAKVSRLLTARFFDSIMAMLDDEQITPMVATSVAAMKFENAADVLRIVYLIDGMIRGPGQDILEQVQDGEEVEEEEMHKYLVILELLRTLMTNYGISEEDLERFSPNKISKKDRRPVTKLMIKTFEIPGLTKESFIEEIDRY